MAERGYFLQRKDVENDRMIGQEDTEYLWLVLMHLSGTVMRIRRLVSRADLLRGMKIHAS